MKTADVLREAMDESPESIVLAHLRAIRSDLAEVQGSLGEIRGRLGNLENGQASIIQHLGRLAAADAQQQVAVDRLTERLVRIERRLELRG
ncbi:hypothetical protein [Reyranella sp.]|uniref:hypothetical protein n=1 Tax=Reyranella sp. TaxID=1929291 RepID=UPI0025CEEE6E|nr:hypothetical protein [Reyranella sp.]